MAEARSAAALDLVERLGVAGFGRIHLLAAEETDRRRLEAAGASILPSSSGPFVFGRALSQALQRIDSVPAAYFGGASAPLASETDLRRWLTRAGRLPAGGALVNNLHSTDWAIFTDSAAAVRESDRFPTDNAIGWTLAHQAGVPVEALAPGAASRADLDTPGDLALIRRHPGLGPSLRRQLADLPEPLGRRADRLATVMKTPAASLALIGRVSESAWRETVRTTQLWVRVYAEERGMRASGRQQRGEVRSLIAELVDLDGSRAFLQRLGMMVEACLWDTRVWMAQRGGWPSAADRMAADLGWPDQVGDPALRQLTQAIAEAPLAVVSGGHGVVSGSLLAMLEAIAVESGSG